MRNLAGLLLVLLVALMITSMPSFKGLSIIQLDRLSELSVGTDPGGALGIAGLDDGISGAIPISGNNPGGGADDIYVGEITNNFDTEIHFDVAVEVEATIFEYSGNQVPEWVNISLFFEKDGETVEELGFENIGPGDLGQELTAEGLLLSPGETLVVLFDGQSYINKAKDLESFQAEARFSITGGSAGAENLTFDLEPSGDLRQQYFSWTDDYVPPEPTGVSYPVAELEYTDNLTGDIDYLKYDPDSDAANNNWYEANDSEANTVLHVELEAPDNGTLVGTQTIKVLVRRTDIGNPGGQLSEPVLDIDLRQDGSYIASLVSEQEVTDPVGQVFTYYFEADELNELSGVNLEVWLQGETKKHGNIYNTVEYGAIEWGYVTE
ncbi:MAG: hypothetical protein R6U91_02530 [Bacillota bacterium]